MKLTELDPETTTRRRPSPPDAGDDVDVDVDVIRVARLLPVSRQPAALANPTALVFVTEEPRRRQRRISSRAALPLVAAVMAATFLWVLIDSNPTRTPPGSPRASLRLTPAEQRIGAAERARAAAIAQAKRDRGTDAQWEDTIPAPAPPTSSATP